MSERYELIYGFIHCRGKTIYHAGFAKTRADAEAWVRARREEPKKLKAPPDDPIRYCRAEWCPFRRQQPWFDFRSLPEGDEPGPDDETTAD